MRRHVIWAVGIVLSGLSATVVGQSLAPRADELFTASRPHLEAVLGRRLPSVPTFQAATPAELAALPDGPIDLQVAWQFPELDDSARTRARAAATAALRGASVAGHRAGSDVILFAPDNAARIARWDRSLAEADSTAFLRLALVHETTRWLLEQRYDLQKRRAACRDSEELLALQALIEGRCQWVTRHVARRLGDATTFSLLAEAFQYAPDTEGEGTVRVLCRDVLTRRRWCYRQGLAFFDYLEREGVKDVEARVFARPPRLLAWIDRPELYLRAQRLDLGDLADVLERVAGMLPSADWQVVQQPWTPAMVQQAAGLLGEGRRAAKVADGWDAGRSLVWSGRARPAQQVALGVVRFQDAMAARSYYGLAVDLGRKQDELLAAACAGRFAVLESRTAALRLNGADEAVRADRKVRLGDKGEPVTITQVWVRAGARVVEFTWHGAPADADWAQRVLDALGRQ